MDFTISIPTYNRVKLLKRNLENLEKLDYEKNKFEIIVIDDGSSDETKDFIKKYSHQSNLKITYHYQDNSGKYYALRRAIDLAKGKYFINCDSDDYLLPDTLLKLKNIINNNEINNIDYAGIIGHNLNKKTNRIQGDLFPIVLSDPIEMRFKYKVNGDKFPCFKTNIIKKYNFPDYRGKTKFIPESFLFYNISVSHKFFYVNDVFQVCEYQSNGLTNQINAYRIKNAFGCFKVYELFVHKHKKNYGVNAFFRNYINYRRFGYHLSYKIKSENILNFLLSKVGWFIYKKDLHDCSNK